MDRVFYHNAVTKETAWRSDLPSYVPYQDASGKPYWFDETDKASTYLPPTEEAAWLESTSTEHRNAAGQFASYFYNTLSKVSTWELPAQSNLAWNKHHVEMEL
jgi:hypothetical protein